MKLMIKMLIPCLVICGAVGIVMAKGSSIDQIGSVDPVNAVLATVIVLAVGVIIYLKRHRRN